MALEHWLQLSLTDGIGPILSRRIIAACGSVEAACSAGANALAAIEGIGPAKARKIEAALRKARSAVDVELNRANSIGVQILCPEDASYPPLIHSIPDPPNVLYVRGGLEDRDLHSVAIVGSRKCSFYGREQAERFAALLAGAGITVTSGGARGIDSAAHHGAMSHPAGRTIAVLGCGVDVVYPPENTELFARIAERGAILSEFPLGTPPNKENFPRRNRIVSGISRGVLIVEADERSGALITARQACDDHGRPVFALPGRVDNPLSAGPHKLIRDGATLVTNLQDIVDALDPVPHDLTQDSQRQSTSNPARRQKQGEEDSTPILFDDGSKAADRPSDGVTSAIGDAGLSDQQRHILGAIGNDAASVDLIVDRAALPVQVVLRELTFLSLKGRVRRVDGQTYERRQANAAG